MVRALHDRGKLVLAYIDIGQAEDFRTYWGQGWCAPTDGTPGDPEYLLTVDPDGWFGDYPVAFWDPRWRKLILHDKLSPLQLALDDGFDGCYLDWVSAYKDSAVVREAAARGVSTASAMAEFLRELREIAHRRVPDFLVVQQNAPELIDDAVASLDLIDGLALEDLSFSGGADTAWDDPESGDRPQDGQTQVRMETLIGRYRASEKAVFCVDYALQATNIAAARAEAEHVGCVSFVSRTPLDRLPDTAGSGVPTILVQDETPVLPSTASGVRRVGGPVPSARVTCDYACRE